MPTIYGAATARKIMPQKLFCLLLLQRDHESNRYGRRSTERQNRQTNNDSNQIQGIEANGDVIAKNINVNIGHGSAQTSQGSHMNYFWTVEAPVVFFVGRTELLKQVHKKLQELLPNRHFMRRIVALVGMGGMGKTEIARKLAHQYRDHYKNVAWIDAKTKKSVRDSFLKIAEILELPGASSETRGEKLAHLVYRHISEHVKTTTLFIFDQANQLKTAGYVTGINDYLPRRVTEGLPLILLTSRMTEWSKDFCEVIHIPELTSEESLACLRSRFRLSREAIQNDRELRVLLDDFNGKLNGYPIAVGLAVANISYIAGQSSKQLIQALKKYTQYIDDNKFLEHRLDGQAGAGYPHAPLELWNITMNNLERRKSGTEAKCLLGIVAYCSGQDLKAYLVKTMYEVRSYAFGVPYPIRNYSASFEEALHALQAVDLVKYDEGQENVQCESEIKVRPIVQTLLLRICCVIIGANGSCFVKPR